MTCITTETPKFHIIKHEDQKAVKIIHKIYKTNGDDYLATQKVDQIRLQSNKQTSKVTYVQALWSDERYRRATYVGATVISFHALTMSVGIHMFSNRLLNDILKPG